MASPTSCVMFADDSLIYDCSCKPGCLSGDCCNLQDGTDKVNSWAQTWGASFNATKSVQLFISRSRSVYPPASTSSSLALSLNKQAVPIANSTRHLGLVISSNLKWSDHVDEVLSSVGWKVYLLKKLLFKSKLSLSAFSYLYTSLIRPSLEYGSAVWDNCSSSDCFSLERLQLSLARAALTVNLGSFSIIKLAKCEILRRLGWPTLAWRRRRFKLILLWKLRNGQGPPALQAKLPPPASARCSYSLRNANSLQIPFCSSSAYLSSFMPSSSLLWNSLPSAITSCTSLSTFSRSLDTFFSSDFYSFGLPP